MKVKPITTGLALVLATMVFAAPQSKITKITHSATAESVQISIIGDNLETPKTFWVLGDTGYVVEFKASLIAKPNLVRVGKAGVDYLRYVRFSARPPVCRIFVKTTKATKPTVSEVDGTWTISVGTTKVTPVNAETLSMDTAIEMLAVPASSKSSKTIVNNKTLRTFTELPTESKTATTEVTQKTYLTPSPKAPVGEDFPYSQSKVTLVFDQTDVLAILKALATQADINIISAPDVSTKNAPLLLTLSMKKVDLDFAMTAVTSMAGLRFTRIGNTFVVSKASNFSEKVRPLIDRSGDRYETRVVNLASGESKQIKDATMQAIPQDGPDGYYEIIDPTFNADPVQVAGATGTPAAPASGGQPATATPATTGATSVKQRAKYVMLIGEPRRLDVIEAYVRDLDSRITESFSLAGANNFGTSVVPVMSGETEKIKQMLKNLLMQNPRKDDFSIEEAAVKELTEGEESTKMLLIAGPKSELNTLSTFASSMDDELSRIAGIEKPKTAAEFEKFYEVIDLKYVEPTLAAFDLKNRVRGLHVTILPDPVTPGLQGKENDKKQDAPNDAQTGTATQQTADVTREVGHEQMRLVLRGTRGQIDAAKQYLMAVDIPSRQVAVELRVMELSREEALRLGLDWNILTGGRLQQVRFNQGLGGNITQGGTFSAKYQNNATDQFNVLGTLDAMANKNNLIARPNALITDGRSSRLFVGDTVRYIKTINASQNGTTVEIDKVEVGVTIDLQARIGAGGNIAFALDQNFSFLKGFTPVPGGGAIPQTSDRSAQMFVNMLDGETIALGGLILDQDIKKESGLPILKDLPIIGALFKRIDNSRQRTEVVFFLTAKVVEGHNPGMAAEPKKEEKGK